MTREAVPPARVVLTFPTTHSAMAAEDLLRAVPLALQVIPPPPDSGKVCGLAIRLAAADLSRAEGVLSAAGVDWSVSD